MSHYILIILLFLQPFTKATAAEESIRVFAQNLEKLFGIHAKRTLEIGEVTRFTTPFITNRNAEASYNPLLNTIYLKNENLISSGGTYIVKSINQLKQEQPFAYQGKVSTIFHELGHSEMDQFIFSNLTAEDRMLVQLYNREFIPWARRNFPGVNTMTLFQEIYGYYHGGVIETLFQDKTDIEILNGYNIFQKKCFKSFYLKKVIETLSKEEFSELLYPDNDPQWEKAYSEKFMPRYVFINGKDFDLMKNPNDPFLTSLKKALWNYFLVNYHAPANMRELAVHFKTHHEDLKFIKECRYKMWDEFHANANH